MSTYQTATDEKDPALWRVAKKRAGFKKHLLVYILVNLFLWAIWYFSGDKAGDYGHNRFPWPIWTTLGWGIGLLGNYTSAYGKTTSSATEREYQKLKKNQP